MAFKPITKRIRYQLSLITKVEKGCLHNQLSFLLVMVVCCFVAGCKVSDINCQIDGQKQYTTSLSWIEILKLPFTTTGIDNRAIETTYVKPFSSPRIVKEAANKNGATFVFITKYLFIPALDRNPSEESIFKLLDRGVDGIMTNQPECIRKIMDKWLKNKLVN